MSTSSPLRLNLDHQIWEKSFGFFPSTFVIHYFYLASVAVFKYMYLESICTPHVFDSNCLVCLYTKQKRHCLHFHPLHHANSSLDFLFSFFFFFFYMKYISGEAPFSLQKTMCDGNARESFLRRHNALRGGTSVGKSRAESFRVESESRKDAPAQHINTR